MEGREPARNLGDGFRKADPRMPDQRTTRGGQRPAAAKPLLARAPSATVCRKGFGHWGLRQRINHASSPRRAPQATAVSDHPISTHANEDHTPPGQPSPTRIEGEMDEDGVTDSQLIALISEVETRFRQAPTSDAGPLPPLWAPCRRSGSCRCRAPPSLQSSSTGC